MPVHHRWLRQGASALLAAMVLAPAPVLADTPFSTALGRVSLKVESLRERQFRGVIRQRYDFSCGSAAVATLLTHHYDRPVTEEQVFRAMFAVGNQEAIRRHGFSLFDMRAYLGSIGLPAEGYRVPLEEVARVAVPAIALVEVNGYRHFVVIKGVRNDEVLVGDPALGVRTYSRKAFNDIWAGVILVIEEEVARARRSFNRDEAWNAYRRLDPKRLAQARPMQPLTLIVSGFGQF